MIEPVNDGVISKEAMIDLHNNGSKKWKLTGYYSNYKEDSLNDDLTKCMSDEIFTFFNDNNQAYIELGNESCYANLPDTEEELVVATYDYEEEKEKLYLTFTRGRYSSVNNITSVSIIILKCVLLTPNKMVFTSGGSENDGRGLVFENILSNEDFE
jgi:hypothetical protein